MAFGTGPHDGWEVIDTRGGMQPYGAGVSPVALHTAVLSMAGFEPSRNELNILGFRPPTCACSGVRPGSPIPSRVWTEHSVQPLVPTPGSDNSEAGRTGPGPRDREIRAGHRRQDCTRRPSPARGAPATATEGISLDGHHDHVLAVPESGERMFDRRYGVTSRLNDDVDLGMGYQGLPVIAHVRRA